MHTIRLAEGGFSARSRCQGHAALTGRKVASDFGLDDPQRSLPTFTILWLEVTKVKIKQSKPKFFWFLRTTQCVPIDAHLPDTLIDLRSPFLSGFMAVGISITGPSW